MNRSEARAIKHAAYRRAHYLANKARYQELERNRYKAKMEANPNRECKWCGEPYPRTQYGPRVFCSKICRKLSQRDTILQRKYGITLEIYNAMLEEQQGRCALCQRKSRLTLAVEHSHITGTVRGLCCMACNRDLIGPLDGDLEKLDRAIAFLQRARDDLAKHQAMPEQGVSSVLPVETTGRPVVPLYHREP
jgi:recombination endonuclease VII